MPLSKSFRLLTAAGATLALLAGFATPAQAAVDPTTGRPDRDPQPACSFLGDCRTHDAYGEMDAILQRGLASDDVEFRSGTMRYLLLSTFGNVAIWGDGQSVTVNNATRAQLEGMLESAGTNTSSAAMNCYGDFLLHHVVTRGANDNTVQDFYRIVEGVKAVRDAKDELEDAYDRTEEYIRALAEPRRALRLLMNDRAKELLNEATGVDGDAIMGETDMTSAYIQMILDSRGPVSQAQYDGAIGQVFYNAVPACTNLADPAPVIKSKVQYLSAKRLLRSTDNPTSYKKYGGCRIEAKHLACWAKPWVSKRVGYTPLRINPHLKVPKSIEAAAKPGTLRMQVTAAFSKVKGKVSWSYAASYALGFKPVSTSLKRPGAVTLAEVDISEAQRDPYGKHELSPVLDFTVSKPSRATFEAVQVRYTYEAR